mmetsp:Transcript_50695/g.142831  ORF Transcript_50695/g.142831 Transcript_50695/m.142831 type:complete len:469 (-) Transcript_50695:207-1613(-)
MDHARASDFVRPYRLEGFLGPDGEVVIQNKLRLLVASMARCPSRGNNRDFRRRRRGCAAVSVFAGTRVPTALAKGRHALRVARGGVADAAGVEGAAAAGVLRPGQQEHRGQRHERRDDGHEGDSEDHGTQLLENGQRAEQQEHRAPRGRDGAAQGRPPDGGQGEADAPDARLGRGRRPPVRQHRGQGDVSRVGTAVPVGDVQRVRDRVTDEDDQGYHLNRPDRPAHDDDDEEGQPAHDPARGQHHVERQEAVAGERPHPQERQQQHDQERQLRAGYQLLLRLGPDPQVRGVPRALRPLRGGVVVAREVLVPPLLVVQGRLRGRVPVDVDGEHHVGRLQLVATDPHVVLAGEPARDAPLGELEQQGGEAVDPHGEPRLVLLLVEDPVAEVQDPAPLLGHAHPLEFVLAEGVEVPLRPGLPHVVLVVEAPGIFKIGLSEQGRLRCHLEAEDDVHDRPGAGRHSEAIPGSH